MSEWRIDLLLLMSETWALESHSSDQKATHFLIPTTPRWEAASFFSCIIRNQISLGFWNSMDDNVETGNL